MAAPTQASPPPGRGRWLRYLVAAWLILLAASHLWRALVPPSPQLRPGQQAVEVPLFIGDQPTDRSGRLAYFDFGPEDPSAPTVVLVHGNPVSSPAMVPLARALAGDYRVLVPDLPGFPASIMRDVPDLSVEAQAHSLLAWLDKLGVVEAHWIGYSQGGGVILRAAEAAPERIRSLVMVSAIGVQETELLGDYTLNRALYALQQGVAWLLQEGLPHFGWWDTSYFSTNYTRNFLETDQRPLRGILTGYSGPMLITQGRSDRLVPPRTAREHHRIVPQSRLLMHEGGHLVPINQVGRIAPAIHRFIAEAEAGRALTRADASAERLSDTRKPMTTRGPEGSGRWLLVGLIALATLASEDLTAIAAGLLAARDVLPIPMAILAPWLGILFGDCLLYLAGRLFGSGAIRRAPLRWMISPQRLRRGEAWFRRHGIKVVLVSRFLPGTRLATYVAAGTLRQPFSAFFLTMLVAVSLWTPFLVGLSLLIGEPLLGFVGELEGGTVPLFLLTIALVWMLSHLGVHLATRRSRRRLFGCWRRLTRWEYWPPWAVYPPVLAYVLANGIRHRCLTLFTCVNPGMPASGLVMESKAAILQALAADPGNQRYLPSFRRISAGPVSERLTALDQFMTEADLTWPLILKPDIGERGMGVARIQSRDQAETYFRGQPAPVIGQALVEGSEYGILYSRQPDADRGLITSLAEKVPTVVTGDGKRTLETLIIDDDRAVAMADFFCDQWVDRLDWVPAAGETVRLSELGTHCRGAIFLDAGDRLTPELTDLIDTISRRTDGFFLGRFDVRISSGGDIRTGRGLQILELNGISAEPAHIYDPRFGLFAAWGALLGQWRSALRIARINRDRGEEPMSLHEVIGLLRAWRAHHPVEAPAGRG
ncbi:MAG: alpha/beta fold hydrolase [Opitutales bacterium]